MWSLTIERFLRGMRAPETSAHPLTSSATQQTREAQPQFELFTPPPSTLLLLKKEPSVAYLRLSLVDA